MSLADELLATIGDETIIHEHPVTDIDSHYIINTNTREIEYKDSTFPAFYKHQVVMQFDHNSEIFTFEIPRYIENHDMSLCNRVRVHFINIDGTNGTEHRDVAEMDDLHVDPENENRLLSTWTIRREATQLAGNLSFAVQYMCVADDGEVVYEWHTDIYSDVEVKPSLDNSEASVVEYTNILEEWYQKLFVEETPVVSDEQIAKAVSDYLTENPIEKVTEEELAAAISEYFLEHPIEGDGVTDEQIAQAVEDYMAENPVEVVQSSFVVQDTAPENTDLLWIDPDDETETYGGYYTPVVTQPDANTMEVVYTPSSGDMPTVTPVQVTLPEGPKGDPGNDGTTPHIGENGNWWIGEEDTGVYAGGTVDDGTEDTPTVDTGGSSKEWNLIIDTTITEENASVTLFVNEDVNGKSFSYKELSILWRDIKFADGTESGYAWISLNPTKAGYNAGKLGYQTNVYFSYTQQADYTRANYIRVIPNMVYEENKWATNSGIDSINSINAIELSGYGNRAFYGKVVIYGC